MSEAATTREARGPHTWVIALVYVGLTLLLTYPLSVRPASTVIGADPDTELYLWTLAWDTHAFTDGPLTIFDANIYFPQRRTLAYSENLIGSAIFAAPILWLTGNPVLALNIVTLLSIVLCGLGMYLLGRCLGMSAAGAMVSGLVFAFAPARFFRISQLHLTTVQWMPFGLASLHQYLDGGRARDLRLAVALFMLQALTSGHGAVFLLVAMSVLLLYRTALREPLDAWRRVRDLGVVGAVLLIPAVLIVLPYHSVQLEMGLRRGLENWAPTPESFLASPTHLQTFLLSLFPAARITERASAILFPGFLPTLLAVVAVFTRRRPAEPAIDAERGWWRSWAGRYRRDATILYALLTLLSVLLASGPPIGLWPLVYWLPGMNFIRVPSRFMILAMLGLSVLAGLGFERVKALVRTNGRRLLTPVIVTLLLLEFVAIPFDLDPYHVRLPAADRWLRGQPKPFVVAEVPVEANERYQTAYMLHSMAHWQKTVHGYSGMRPSLHEALYAQLRSFPDESSLERLAQLGVTFVVVHADQYQPGEWPMIEARLSQYAAWLRVEYQDAGARVYSLRRPSSRGTSHDGASAPSGFGH